jgi:hypothetical protein
MRKNDRLFWMILIAAVLFLVHPTIPTPQINTLINTQTASQSQTSEEGVFQVSPISGGCGGSPQTSENIISVQLTLTPEYGDSGLIITKNILSVLSGGQTITGVKATAIITPSGGAVVQSVSGCLNLSFDSVQKKTKPLTANGATLSVTSTEIEEWDNGTYANHTLTISSSGSLIMQLSGGGTESGTLSPISINLILKIPKPPDEYIISVSGSTYTAKNGYTTLYTGSSAYSAIQDALSIAASGQTVIITSGTYPVTSTLNLNGNGVILKGESAIIQATNSLSSDSRILNVNGNQDTVDGVIFDANLNRVISPVVLVGGDGNIVQNCELRNAIQYGIQAWKANNFKFLNNKVNKAQYGLCTGGNINGYSTNGLIQGNTIIDCQDCGIKLKWAKNIMVTGNIIDTAYLTWTTNASGNTKDGSRAIDFYTDDGPLNNIVVSSNIITDSKRNKKTVGILEDADLSLSNPSAYPSSGLQINNNTITGTYYGILIKKAAEITYIGNVFNGVRYQEIAIWG